MTALNNNSYNQKVPVQQLRQDNNCYLFATSSAVTSMTAAEEETSPATRNSSSNDSSSYVGLVRWPTIFHSVDEDCELDWEERAEDTSMGVHIVAGSFAGMVEHLAIFPLDTIRTHSQSVSSASKNAFETAQHLFNVRGPAFFWRGSMALAWAVVPAHAALFSTYEAIMNTGLPDRHLHMQTQDNNTMGNLSEHQNNLVASDSSVAHSGQRVAIVGFVAGTVSGFIHDLIMVPAETVKQRLQLGYYKNASHAIRRMAATGGHSFYRSLPITLAMSIPYSSLMMASNETIRWYLNPSGSYSLPTFLLAGAISGSFAAAATTPLDVIRTRLNVQNLKRAKTSTGELNAAPKEFKVRYHGFVDAFTSISNSPQGASGFFRGVGPRVLQLGPSCALSWCAYETAKKLCATIAISNNNNDNISRSMTTKEMT